MDEMDSPMDHSGGGGQTPPMTPAEARQRALGWLARREHSEQELRRKLARLDCPAPVIDAVATELVAEGLLSDERFAEMLSRTRFGRGFGPARVRAELRQKGVDEDTIAAYAKLGQAQMLRQAREALEKRFGSLPARDLKSRAQRARFLAYKGFPADVIFRVLDADGGEGCD